MRELLTTGLTELGLPTEGIPALERYAGMLVGTLCRKLLAEGVRPMLYADAAYPSSNRAYQKIGFTKTGEVTEYAFRRR